MSKKIQWILASIFCSACVFGTLAVRWHKTVRQLEHSENRRDELGYKLLKCRYIARAFDGDRKAHKNLRDIMWPDDLPGRDAVFRILGMRAGMLGSGTGETE